MKMKKRFVSMFKGRKTKAYSFFLSFAFACFVFLPLAVLLIGKKPDQIENRRVTEWPRPEANRLLDPGFYEQAASAMRDRLPYRRKWVRLNAFVAYRLFGDSPNKDVLIGKDGWLFLRDDYKALCRTDVTVPVIYKGLSEMASLIRSSGRTFVFAIAPNKAGLYLDSSYPADVPLASCGKAKADDLRQRLKKDAASWYVDVWSEIERRVGSGEKDLYYKTDDHWTDAGGRILASMILKRIAPNLRFENDKIVSSGEKVRGSSMRLMGLKESEAHTQLAIERPGVTRVVSEMLDAKPGFPQVEHYVHATTKAPLSNKRLLIIHDSFGYFFLDEMLIWYFKDVKVANWSSYTPEILAEAIAAADIIVMETTERDVPFRTDSYYANPDFHKALKAALRER
ncbi:MAG: hypothetical protein PHE27_00640 [Alphaproteobacteria bacterium]|nr:hypothetical protein [Alphaproteobacteria bacterium]